MDDAHANFICEQTGINRHRCALLPNAVAGSARSTNNGWLRQQFGLKRSDVLVLHAGGIGAAQQRMELARAARSWPESTHLVFQAHCRMDHESYYREFAEEVQTIENVHLSSQAVARDQLDAVVGSADIGIAWYDRELLGYRADLLGLAAGKIGRCLRNGVPVIARSLPTVQQYIDRYSCGLCVDRCDEIASAIERVMKHHEQYRREALRCYEELWRAERYFPEIERRIRQLVADPAGRSEFAKRALDLER
jgi:glycosyltransferase involved in cell wall biosynthesis